MGSSVWSAGLLHDGVCSSGERRGSTTSPVMFRRRCDRCSHGRCGRRRFGSLRIVLDTRSRGGRGWRMAVAAFVVVLVAMAGAAVVFLGLTADFVRDEVVLRQRGQVTSATVLEINRSERRKNLPAQVVLAYVGPGPVGRGEGRGGG